MNKELEKKLEEVSKKTNNESLSFDLDKDTKQIVADFDFDFTYNEIKYNCNYTINKEQVNEFNELVAYVDDVVDLKKLSEKENLTIDELANSKATEILEVSNEIVDMILSCITFYGDSNAEEDIKLSYLAKQNLFKLLIDNTPGLARKNQRLSNARQNVARAKRSIL